MLFPGLRSLQSRDHLQKLLQRVKAARKSIQWGDRGPPPLLVKISPDISEEDKKDIATAALRFGFDGLIVSNTTTSRPGLQTLSTFSFLPFCLHSKYSAKGMNETSGGGDMLGGNVVKPL